MDRYHLPELAYDYSAFEPALSGRMLELHHQEHHAKLVRAANITLERLRECRETDDYCALAGLQRALAYYASGATLHALFWASLTPNPAAAPEGELALAIDRDFGTIQALKRHLNEAAATLMGSGWAALVWDPVAQQLLINQIFDNQSNFTAAAVPLLVLDAWEHAYQLDYQHRKSEFFDTLWRYWDWRAAGRRLASAQRLQLGVANSGR